MIDRALIASRALSYVGTPTVHQGRTPFVGLDCIGVPLCAARAEGVVHDDFDFNGYVRSASPNSISDECARWMAPVSRDQMQAGDVIAVRFRDGDPQHIGVLYDHPFGGLGMVHADNKLGRVVAQRLVFTAFMRFVSAWRMPWVE